MDPAIDTEATGQENLKKFKKNFDMSLLKFKKDDFPTIFHIKNILGDEQAELQEEHYQVEMPEVKEGVTAAELALMKPTVKQIKTQSMIIKYFRKGVVAYEENNEVTKEFDHNIFPPIVQTELGAFILSRSQLGGEEKKS